MHEILLYLASFFMVFLLCAILTICLRLSVWVYAEYYDVQNNTRRQQRCRDGRRNVRVLCDRQGNIFTIADEASRNQGPHHYAPDFFYIEPNSEDAARIRAQLEKDDKDLPSYEDVMRITSLEANEHNTGSSRTTIATTDTDLTAPPYSEVDPYVTTTNTPNNETIINIRAPVAALPAASTSRAAAALDVPIANSASHSNV